VYIGNKTDLSHHTYFKIQQLTAEIFKNKPFKSDVLFDTVKNTVGFY